MALLEPGAGTLKAAGHLILERIAFAAVFAAQIDEEAEEEEAEGPQAEFGDVEVAGQERMVVHRMGPSGGERVDDLRGGGGGLGEGADRGECGEK